MGEYRGPGAGGRLQGALVTASPWRLDADGTAAIDNPILAETRRWCVHRQGDRLAGDALWFYDDVDDQRGLQIEDVGAVLRVTLLDNDVVYELVGDTPVGEISRTSNVRVCDDLAPEAVARGNELHFVGTEQVRLAGALHIPVGESPSWESVLRFAGHRILTDSFLLMAA